MVDDSERIPAPAAYTKGSLVDAQLVAHWCKRAWEESEDAMVIINEHTCSFVSVYKGPASEQLELRRGGGFIFPSLFQPLEPSSLAIKRFPSRPCSGDCQFVFSDRPGEILVFVDGACPNNGQPNARAGWAVVYGPGNIVSGQLEDKGPFGDNSVATSSRAELRAAITALRLRDWVMQGVNQIIIATDWSYVVAGSTNWAKVWGSNGWKKSKGKDVKNKDLWELLLGEVERWIHKGLRVFFWKIPQGLNTAADAGAKAAAEKGPAEAEFRDVVVQPSTTRNARILTICLGGGALFDSAHSGLVSWITSKATVERATTPEAALDILTREPPPPVILVADSGLTRQKEVWECVIDHLRRGATVVLAGCFSSMLNAGEFNRFFRWLGLPWKRGSYHREKVKLRPQAASARLVSRLPAAYSQTAQFVANVDPSEILYAGERATHEAAVAFAPVGAGKLGYIGDVNGEKGSIAVVLGMCGLLG